MHVLNEVTVR